MSLSNARSSLCRKQIIGCCRNLTSFLVCLCGSMTPIRSRSFHKPPTSSSRDCLDHKRGCQCMLSGQSKTWALLLHSLAQPTCRMSLAMSASTSAASIHQYQRERCCLHSCSKGCFSNPGCLHSGGTAVQRLYAATIFDRLTI